MNDWLIQNLEQLPIELIDGDRSSRYPKRDDYLDYSEIIFLNADSVSSGKLDISKVNYLSEQIYAGITKGRLSRGDLVITMRGNGVGKVAYYGVNNRGLINAQMLIIRPNAENIDSRYLYYYLSNPVFQHELRGYVSGSAQPQLTITHLKRVPITLPPLPEQRAIAEILGSLDDKIEANRRQNETLEATARAIFQSWFVDFDPVHAKARGETPLGLDAETAALFPDSFEESALGPIPRGWRVRTLGDVCEKPQYGYTASATDEPVGPKFLRITDINKASWVNWESVPYCEISDSDYAKYKLSYGDIVIARMADPGHAAFFEDKIEAVFASYLIRFKPGDNSLDRYLQYWLASNKYWDQVNGAKTGTTRSSLNAQVLSSFKLILPPSEICEAFSGIVRNLRTKIVANNDESRTLAETRDALLPRLVSGELRVGEVEDV